MLTYGFSGLPYTPLKDLQTIANVYIDPSDMMAYAQAEYDKWGKVIKTANPKIEQDIFLNKKLALPNEYGCK